MKIIDNVNEFLGDDLKASIEPGSKLRIAASTFSIFAFEALKAELEEIDELEFIFTSPSFVDDEGRPTSIPRQRREFFIPSDRTGSRRSTARSSRSGCETS